MVKCSVCGGIDFKVCGTTAATGLIRGNLYNVVEVDSDPWSFEIDDEDNFICDKCGATYDYTEMTELDDEVEYVDEDEYE